ncbi:MAG: hypothetical protein ABEJ57_01200 [Halobacteriaceae archaeon]
MQSLGELGVAAYCPRQLWYRRRDEGEPTRARTARALALQYPSLRAETVAPDGLAVPVATVAARLDRVAAAFPDAWPELSAPSATDVRLEGRAVRGEVAKVLATDPPVPTIVAGGAPPTDGVWNSHGVRAVGAMQALSWERDRSVERAFVEYPRHGVVRAVTPTARRRARFRRVQSVVASMTEPPSRVANDAKCSACAYRAECGVRTRALSSLF